MSACASSKKESFISRAYHDITARDNGYFNAKLLLAQSAENLWNSQEEDYSKTLPIFKFGTKDAAQGEQSSLDEVIKKSSIVIQLHKKSKWVDDCYLLIGKANFYERNYEEAITSFQYIINKYEEGPRKKKKKKKKKKSDESNFIAQLQHQPVANEAALWIVRSLVEEKKYSDAKTALAVIKGNTKFPEELLDELYATEAHLYQRQGQTESCINALTLAAEGTKDKALKARYHFILAQLNEQLGNYQQSVDELNRVIKLKPDYVTDFYARLYVATQGMQYFGMSSQKTEGILKDMLKEDKYKEFFPLIYNTLADIEIAGNNTKGAKDYLRMGIKTGDVDPEEKAISYVKLGDIYYDAAEFQPAYNSYDSALMSLNREYARHREVMDRRDGLIDLVKALKTIETEKRLQFLAGLNDYALELEIAKMIAEDEAANQQDFLTDGDQNQNVKPTGSGTDFYFYNLTLLSRGQSEFKLKWGARKLEDNWRRSDKRSYGEEDIADNIGTQEPEESDIDLNSDKLTREQIINSLPKSEEALATSNDRIAGALYKAGSIYRQKFSNNKKASEYFDQNINDYPENAFELQSLYQQYVIFDGLPKQDVYRSAILVRYPNSLFANLIRDPNYLQNQLKKDEEVEAFYATTYEYYTAGDLTSLKARLVEADSLYPNNPLQPQFDMLRALSLANSEDTEPFAAALNKVINDHPDHEVADRAKEILKLINKGEEKEEVSGGVYNYKPKEEHYAIIMLPAKSKDATTVKNKLADFNTKNYNLKKLRISSLLFGNDQTLVLIKTFDASEDAMNYYRFLNQSFSTTFEGIDMGESSFFVVSKSNYVQLYKSKDLDTYVDFFNEFYTVED